MVIFGAVLGRERQHVVPDVAFVDGVQVGLLHDLAFTVGPSICSLEKQFVFGRVHHHVLLLDSVEVLEHLVGHGRLERTPFCFTHTLVDAVGAACDAHPGLTELSPLTAFVTRAPGEVLDYIDFCFRLFRLLAFLISPSD